MKNSLKYFVRLLVVLSVVVVCVTAAKVSVFVFDGRDVGGRIEKALAVDPNSDDSLKAVQLKYAETVKTLKKKSLFALVPEKKNPVKQVDGIIGDSALIGGKLYKKGDKIGDAVIVSVDADAVTILWNEKEKRITPFDHFVAPVVKKTKKKSKPKSKPAEKTVVVQEPEKIPPRQMERRGGRELSSEERRKMREKMRAKMREKNRDGKGR